LAKVKFEFNLGLIFAKVLRESIVNDEEGKKAMEVILAIYESARSGRPVTIKELRRCKT